MRIAIIGSGIAGMGAAWLTARHADIHLFEVDNRMGGHANTAVAMTPEAPVAVDTGFIVFNHDNYPNLRRLFDSLGVATEATDMSFAVSIGPGRMEYEGSAAGVLAQPANLLKASYWQMLGDLVRFYRTARHKVDTKVDSGADVGVDSGADVGNVRSDDETLAAFVAREGYSTAFVNQYLLPLGAAIWSCPPQTMLDFPVRSFIAFLENHRLMNFTGRPQWRTVSGGSHEYVAAMAKTLGGRVHLNTTITGLVRKGGGVALTIKGVGEVWFDKVIMAGHADQMLPLIRDADESERRILGAFDFQPNRVVLHSDTALMPQRRRTWASWNYLTRVRAEDGICVTYWMNRLQNLNIKTPLLVTLNPFIEPSADLIYDTYFYRHPIFDSKAIEAQAELRHLQGRHGLYFAGAWTRYGFHEDGLSSAVAAVKSLGFEIPWPSPTEAWHEPHDAFRNQRLA